MNQNNSTNKINQSNCEIIDQTNFISIFKYNSTKSNTPPGFISVEQNNDLIGHCVDLVNYPGTTTSDVKEFINLYKNIKSNCGNSVNNILLSFFCMTSINTHMIKNKTINENLSSDSNIEIIKYLLESGADPNTIIIVDIFGSLNVLQICKKITPLKSVLNSFFARTTDDSIKIIELLFLYGLQLNDEVSKLCVKILFTASRSMAIEKYEIILDYLFDKGLKLNIEYIYDEVFNSTVYLNNSKVMIKYLKKFNYDFNNNPTNLKILIWNAVNCLNYDDYIFLTNQSTFVDSMLTDTIGLSNSLNNISAIENLFCNNQTKSEIINSKIKLFICDIVEKCGKKIFDMEKINSPLLQSIKNKNIDIIKFLINYCEVTVNVDHMDYLIKTFLYGKNNGIDDCNMLFEKTEVEIFEILFEKITMNKSFDTTNDLVFQILKTMMSVCYNKTTAKYLNYWIVADQLDIITKYVIESTNKILKINTFELYCKYGLYMYAKQIYNNFSNIENTIPIELVGSSQCGLLSNVLKSSNFAKKIKAKNHHAIEDPYVEIIKLILNIDPQAINETDNKYRTPLHHVCLNEYANKYQAELLINCGANLNHKDNLGMSPYNYATQIHGAKSDIVKLFQNSKCDI